MQYFNIPCSFSGDGSLLRNIGNTLGDLVIFDSGTWVKSEGNVYSGDPDWAEPNGSEFGSYDSAEARDFFRIDTVVGALGLLGTVRYSSVPDTGQTIFDCGAAEGGSNESYGGYGLRISPSGYLQLRYRAKGSSSFVVLLEHEISSISNRFFYGLWFQKIEEIVTVDLYINGQLERSEIIIGDLPDINPDRPFSLWSTNWRGESSGANQRMNDGGGDYAIRNIIGVRIDLPVPHKISKANFQYLNRPDILPVVLNG